MRKRARVLCLIGIVWSLGAAFAEDPLAFENPVGGGAPFAAPEVNEAEGAGLFPARVEKSGQTIIYGPKDDGKLHKGVAWPNPRFTDNGDGTVTDNLTGLVWLKDANCGVYYPGDQARYRNWNDALKAANRLRDGYCGLTDGSAPGNWRLPNRKELESLVDCGFAEPALSDTAGTGHWTAGNPFLHPVYEYWSSTSRDELRAFVIRMQDGLTHYTVKDAGILIWPVRGPKKGEFPARVEKTGQTTSYQARDDGALRKGVAWPTPRFTDNGDGTVRDNLTGLIWLKNANCVTFFDGDPNTYNSRPWGGALVAANRLDNGYCGLTDGSSAGNWRLPNRKELESLTDYEFNVPNTAGTGQWTEGDPFLGVDVRIQFSYYWTSTTNAYNIDQAWRGLVPRPSPGKNFRSKGYVWPVRGPH